MIGRHVERPEELLDLEPRCARRREQRRDPVGLAGVSARPGKDHVVGGLVNAGVPRLVPVDDPLVTVALGVRLHPRGVRAVIELGDPEGEAAQPGRHAGQPLGFLLLGPVADHELQAEIVAATVCSVCRSQCSPRPRRARCSRITAIPRLLPSCPPYSFGNEYRKMPAASARRRASRSNSSHSSLGRPPRSQSVRASSRRWSKKRMLSFSCSRGCISRSMKSSI